MAGIGRISLSYSKVGDIRETHQYNVTATFEIGFNYGGYNSAAKSWSMSCDGQSRSGASSFSVPNGNGSWRYTTITTQTFTVTMNKSGESKTVTVSAYMETGVSPSSISANNSITLPAVTWLFGVAYNSNGGSGSMSTDTVSYGSNYKAKANTFSRGGYTFTGWNEASNGSKADWTPYIGKDWKWTYTNSITLYAQWRLNTYTISYNANGGSGAPASQTKTHGQNLTLSSTKPIKTNYNFLGWSTNQNASVPEYSAGGVCSINANTTLYAVWELAYWAPKITNVFVHRCTDTGVDYGEGTYAMVEFRWECCQIVGVNNVRSIVVEGETISASGTNGNVNAIVGGNYSIDNGYVLNINVTDSKGGASTYQIYLESKAFTIDFKAGGKGVAIGKPADTDNLFDVNWATRVRNKLSVDNAGYFGGGVTEQIPSLKNTDLNTMTTTGKWYVYDGTNRPVAVNGWVEVIRLDNDNIMQRYTTWSNLIYVRTKSNTWDDWTQVITQNQISSRFAGLTMGTPSNLGGTFNRPSGSSPYFRCIQLDGQSAQTADRYFLLIDANGKLYTGIALNGATQITWVEK